MRASVFVGTSLDGFLARPDGTFDFLSVGGAASEPHGFEEFLSTVDAIVMGRNTYEVVLPFPAWPYGRTPVFVLSSRPLPPAPAGALVERLSGHPSAVLSQLASRGIDHVYVDGGATIQAFLRAGRIQRLVISRVPVLIGAGIPLFGALDADVLLRHVGTRQFTSGLVQSEYVVEPGPTTTGDGLPAAAVTGSASALGQDPGMTDPRYPIGRFVPPDVLDSATREECIGRIAAAPARLRAAVAGLTEPQLRTPYRAGGWSVAQVVHHLPDSHMNAYVRFKLAVTEDDPTIKAYDEVRWAELPDASGTDLGASLALLAALHERWVVFLRSLEPAHWDRTFEHPERGTSTLGRTLALYAWHGDHHVAHVTTLRTAMGW